ncbi:hypothetical protein [Brachybacterium sp. AOP29-B2-41]|uniref:hypothetical protein n=1 Tax=Brachybacterium sp. AOP29-B2-41 TaxID=3457704 RepID=UPI0040348270
MVTRANVEDWVIRNRIVHTDMDIDEIAGIISRTDNLAPVSELVRLFRRGEVSRAALTFFLPRVWVGLEANSQVPVETWRAMFEHIAYTEDGIVKSRPRRSVRAFRGATEANRAGLSWSLDPRQAEYFARERQAQRDRTGRVWVVNIPADRVFARVLEGMEKEIVADVRGLRILPVEQEAQLPTLRWWSRR